MKCRFCGEEENSIVLDLGRAPPSNAYLSSETVRKPEYHIPLRIFACKSCGLVQTEDFAQPDLFFDNSYAYFSSASKSWLSHAREYSDSITTELGLNSDSFVTEVASNDGYLLKNFIEKGIPCLGVEPTESTAVVSEQKGINVIRDFFGSSLASAIISQYGPSDLIIGNNVYAHVPNLNDFTKGMKLLLANDGVITLEFPHIQNLVEKNQWDTVYHEHYSYFSLSVVNRVFTTHGLKIYKVEKISTHGGSLRVYGCHIDHERQVDTSVDTIISKEERLMLHSHLGFTHVQRNADLNKNEVLSFLLQQKKLGKKIVGYGAAAKGNTFINYAGIKPDLLTAVFDAAPSKQGKYLPGSSIPVLDPSQIDSFEPDFVWILPWNISEEVIATVGPSINAKTKFFIASPSLQIL